MAGGQGHQGEAEEGIVVTFEAVSLQTVLVIEQQVAIAGEESISPTFRRGVAVVNIEVFQTVGDDILRLASVDGIAEAHAPGSCQRP